MLSFFQRIRPYLFVLVWVLIPSTVKSQNLVPNYSFEEFLNCPYVYNAVPYPASPWVSALGGTADYFNACMNPSFIGVPTNFEGYQAAHTGNAYCGLYTYFQPSFTREFIQVQLTEQMVAGQCYTISFYVSLADEQCPSSRIGAYISADPPPDVDSPIPQIEWQGGYITDTMHWTQVVGFYIASGGEDMITIGNYYSDAESMTLPNCPNGPIGAYFYVDDVVVVQTPEEDFDFSLNGPVMACDSFVIETNLDGGLFVWSDGSSASTLTVYTSGTYSVTAYYGCQMQEDEIDVTIVHYPPVNLPQTLPLICEGESYTITLDPDAGNYEWQDGSQESEYTITESGLYQVTLDNGCYLSSDEVEILFLSAPEPFALSQQDWLCPGEQLHLEFNPDAGVFEWQDQSADYQYTITAPGTYALTISNSCGEATDQIVIEPLDPPDANLGADVSLCQGEELSFVFAEEDGEFLWQDGSTEPYYIITQAGHYQLMITNVCGQDEDELDVEFLEPPVAQIVAIGSFCDGDTLHLNAANLNSTYLWQDGSTDSVLTVTSSGIYSVVVTNLCADAFDSFEASFVPALDPPTLGPDVNLCPGDQVLFSVSTPEAQYLWSDMSTADTLLVQTAGTYSVQVYNACFSYFDTVVVSADGNPPVVQLPNNFALCAGQSSVLDPMINGVTYTWNDGTMLPQLIVFSPGTYSVTVSNACGISMDTIIITEGDPLPTVELGPDTALCAGKTILLIPIADHVDSWLWQDGDMGNQYTATGPGMITVQTNNSCGVANDTIVISMLPAVPMLNLGPDPFLCPDDSLLLAISIQDVSILWSDGTTQDKITIHDSGFVYAVISSQCGTSIDTVEVHALPNVPILDLGLDQTLCPGDVITFSTAITDVNYLWQDGSTQSSFVANQEGTYHLTISNSCGTNSDTVVVTESNLGPALDLGNDIVACEGNSVELSAGIGGVQYVWQDGSTGNVYPVTSSGSYALTVSNSCGTDADTVNVDFVIAPIPIDLGSDRALCEGETLLLNPFSQPDAVFEWQDHTNASSYLISQPGLYSIVVSNTCGITSDSILITYAYPPIPFTLGRDTILCEGNSLLLVAPITDAFLTWQDGSNDVEKIVSTEGVYTLQLINFCGEVGDSIRVDFDRNHPVLSLPPQYVWCPGDLITLNVAQPFQATYEWSTGDYNPSIQVDQPGTFSVEVQTECYTSNGQTIVIPEEDCGNSVITFYVPNVFSPNADQVNDVFAFHTSAPDAITSFEGSIYDRWGNEVFFSNKLPFEWDGRFHQRELQPGVYLYQIIFEYLTLQGIKTSIVKGDVTLIR